MSLGLSPEDRRRLETLFERAADLTPAEHEAFIDRECGPSGALREHLERLLQGAAGEDVLARARAGAPTAAGTRIGPYELLEKIGAGGMGEVYAAQQKEPVVRRVALKVIKPGMDSAQVVARFEAERQALALMSHPNVAQVFDGGTTPEGRPYFVMEYVAGEPITEYCDRRRLPTRARLELFLAVCDGVQHAHQKGLIHRDLKPSNLLVMEQDGRPVPKIIDFGIARATTGSLAERTLHTMVGQVVGTLDYMSPEQADPTAVDIDTRSDIYSLGVVLYQLVSGLLPFELATARERPISELQRTIREQDPPTPSTRLRRETGTAAAIAPLHGTDERSLVRQLAGDLDWITLKALEKDPARRYATTSELAEDLRRHLASEPVLAGRPGALYRARKFVRRNRVAVIAGALTAAGVVAGISGIVSGRLVARALEPQTDEYRARVLLEEAEDLELWPHHPDQGRLDALEAWLGEARALVRGLPGYRARLAEVRSRALSQSEVPKETEPAGPGSWRFASDEDSASNQLLTDLVSKLEELGGDSTGLLALESEFGWSVPERLASARELLAGFAEDGPYARAWEASLPEIRAAYPGLDLRPQVGLLPLGPDRRSKRWEFAHLLTGAPAVRGADGELVLAEETGVVLVLIPGGKFAMGAQQEHEVELSPYLLSKYELTQGQWKRLTGENPSEYGPDGQWEPEWLSTGAPASLLHPVTDVSWWDCMEWLSRVGLTLPSEAQWEVGTRAGTDTPFWSGPDLKDLEGVANLADRHAHEHGYPENNWEREFNDGSRAHWKVGSGRANPFGLHDVHGNVLEWCLDGFDADFFAVDRGVDPVAPWADLPNRVYRGGSFRLPARAARSSAMSFYPPAMKGLALGMRPARAIDRAGTPR